MSSVCEICSTYTVSYMMQISLQLVLQRWEKEIHCKLQETYYALLSRTTTCNVFKNAWQS